jgi:serine/threonine-protein kinase
MADTLAKVIGGHPSIEVGSMIAGKYRVERVLGAGGMGVVVAAIHEQLGDRVAIKLLRGDRLGQPEAVERALREGRAAVKIQSDHVARVFDVGTLDDGAPFIVMEYLAGCDLAQLLCAEGRLAIDDATSYVVQACDALAKAHAMGIVHRDLKPANLFLAMRDDAATLKVLDFGISKVVAGESGRIDPSLTGTAALLGSPAYMSPEQLESTRDVDARTDVWSLGVILFELVTGAHPFVAESLPQLYRRITEQPAPSLRTLRPEAPEELEAIVQRCLAKKKEDRFADVPALAAALEPFAGHAMTTNPKRLSAFAATSIARESGTARSGERVKVDAATPAAVTAPRRPRRAAAFAVAMGVIALGAAAAFGARGGAKREEPAVALAPPPAPLAAPGAVLACPQLRASGVEEPAGWLGAAASSLACMRAQMRMGGRTARVLVPAELLDLPREAVDGFPEDPFGANEARERAVSAAKGRGAAWLDGDVARDGDGFRVALVLRASGDGRELARGEGRDAVLVRAVRGAMDPIERAGGIPAAPDGDPFLVEWYGARTGAAAEALVDGFIVYVTDQTKLAEECASLLARTDLTPQTARTATMVCTRGPSEGNALTALDTSSPGALLASIEGDDPAHTKARSAPEEIALVDAAIAKTHDREGRALLFEIEAQIHEMHGDLERAGESVLRSIHEDPKAIDGFSSAWQHISWLHATSNAAGASIAWAPWSTEAYCFRATQTDDTALKVRYTKRDHVLSPYRIWTEAVAEYLLYDGKRDEARAVSAEANSDALRVLIDASDARFGHALARAKDALAQTAPSEAYAAMYAAANAAQVALILGRDADFVAPLVPKYVDHAGEVDVLTAWLIARSCVLAPRAAATACIAKLRELAGTRLMFLQDAGTFDGFVRFAARDWAGAAAAWRPFAAHPTWQLDDVRDLVSTAFERAGEDDLSARIDAPALARPGRGNGVELAWVREARRAAKRGDAAPARKRAQEVIDAWSVADVEVPAVREMRKLITRLK